MDTSPTVMVVDDDEDLSDLLVQYIGVIGFEAAAVEPTDARQVAATIGSQAPEVVLLDINLGRTTGFEVARHLRALGYAGVVVAMTALQFHERPGQGRLAEFDAYWPKPLDPDRLKHFLQVMHG